MNTTAWLTDSLVPISLSALNAKAAMLEHLDNKYLVRGEVLREAVAEFASVFDVLEIDGKRAFTYDTCYFDDAELHSFHDHHQGRRQRIKVRVRHYVDAALCFVEVKMKDKRGITVKKRLPCSLTQYGQLDDAALAHVEKCHSSLYGRPFGRALAPVLQMRYQRVTLVAREGGLMVGLGETDEEVLAVMRDMRAHHIDMLTIGQYLAPSGHHLPVRRYVHPDTFKMFEREAQAMGFTHAAVGAMVRSSYHADEQAHAAGVAAVAGVAAAG
jgi:hypothetical protein